MLQEKYKLSLEDFNKIQPISEIMEIAIYNKGNIYFSLAQILLYSEIKQNYEEKDLLEESDTLGFYKKWNS